MDDQVIGESRLAALLRVDLAMLRKWQDLGRIRAQEEDVFAPGEDGETFHFSFTRIDAFLENCITDPRHPVTVAQLLAYEQQHKSPALLTVHEVAEPLVVASGTVIFYINRGELPALSLTQRAVGKTYSAYLQVRVPADALKEFMQRPQEAVSITFVEQVLGVSSSTVLCFTAEGGPLTPLPKTNARGELFVTTESFMALLESCVRNCTALEWCALRKAHGYERLMTKSEIVVRCGAKYTTLNEQLTQWPHLVLPRPWTRIPLHLVEAWLATRPPSRVRKLEN